MPAGLPGSTNAQNLANPTAGRAVIFDLLSGPKGSPFDTRKFTWSGQNQVFSNDAANQQVSTGALNTGIGFGSPPIIGPTAPASIKAAGFTDDYTVGVTMPDGTTAAADSRLMYIGGGKSNALGVATPYTAGFGVGMAGNGGSRDAGAGPAFTGFPIKTVTAAGAVANGAAVETGWTNRSGVALVAGQSVFGSSAAASAAPA